MAIWNMDRKYRKQNLKLYLFWLRLATGKWYRTILDSPMLLVTTLGDELKIVCIYLVIEKGLLNGRLE